MKPTRSVLFVPGNRPKWITDAATHGADLIIIDLEDAVLSDETAAARDSVADAIPTVHDNGQRIFIRINGHPNSSADRTPGTLRRSFPKSRMDWSSQRSKPPLTLSGLKPSSRISSGATN
ncbi:aldolase/citrate lyase family protein [Natrinema soli]|uniref:Aldolase/citrate lyase family protein n=1 Tax=Natrinema soli TaxID=1930624 RepID=A0ABD5SFE7_9EURY|nr:aldolase/citrate lyase family protein [Natrinema soli]